MNYMMPHSPKESIKLTDEGILKSKEISFERHVRGKRAKMFLWKSRLLQ